MLVITDIKTGKKYKMLPFREVKKGDIYLLAEAEINQAPNDFPDDMGSFILEEMDMIICHKCGKNVHASDSWIDHAGDNSLYCSQKCRGY